jgi:uncharacterized protein
VARRLALIVIALSAIGTSCRRSSATDVIEHPLLWAAEKDGTTTYLFGTMHAGIDATTRLPPSVFAQLDAAPAFAMETDVPDAELVAAMQRPSGTLRDDLGPDYWHKLEAVISPAQAQAIDRMKPMVAATLLSMRGLPPTPPMDRVMRDRARERGKPIVLLETPADELAVLEKHMNLKALRMMLDDPDRTLTATRQLLDAYVSGNEARILAVLDAQRVDELAHGYTQAEYDEFVADLIDNRNAAWIPVIEKLHAGGGGFVAVGAMHLVGPKSVRALLTARGFRIRRLP